LGGHAEIGTASQFDWGTSPNEIRACEEPHCVTPLLNWNFECREKPRAAPLKTRRAHWRRPPRVSASQDPGGRAKRVPNWIRTARKPGSPKAQSLREAETYYRRHPKLKRKSHDRISDDPRTARNLSGAGAVDRMAGDPLLLKRGCRSWLTALIGCPG